MALEPGKCRDVTLRLLSGFPTHRQQVRRTETDAATSFFMDFVLFVVPASRNDYYANEKPHMGPFQAMCFISSFFSQFGPNSTTFLIAAEVYPTPIRASAHGFSAPVGKLGALTAAVMYSTLTMQQKILCGAVVRSRRHASHSAFPSRHHRS